MSEALLAVARPAWRDYLELTKPRVVLLMLLCAAVGMFLAAGPVPPWNALLFGLPGIALVAASAAAVNHIADASIDARMARTERRPVASGRVGMAPGVVFAAVVGLAGLAVLALLVNPLTAWLNFASWVGYGLIYTLYLKRATPQNIVIGGLFGAAPPLFGWTAVTGSIEPGGLVLVLIIFVWTPPHFWALALDRKEEYERADIPMLPVTHGDTYTRRQILYYTLALVATSVLPWVIGMSGTVYLAAALALGGVFVWYAVALLRRVDGAEAATFRYSIVYLMVCSALCLQTATCRPSGCRSDMKVLTVLGGAAAVVGLGLYFGGLAGDPTLTAEELRGLGYRAVDEPRELEAFELVDGKGRPFDAARLAGRWSFVFFGYANCPDICPVTLSTSRDGR